MDLIQEAMMYLVHREPFFANLVMNMTRNYTTDIPTLGVNVTDTVNLYVNPHFWKNLKLTEQVDILKHECYHVINNHFARFADLEPEIFEEREKNLFEKVMDMQNAGVCNIAGDLAINEYLPNLPQKLNMFDKEGKMIVQPDTIPDPKNPQATIPNPNAGKPVEGSLYFVNNLKKQFPKIENRKNMEYYYDIIKQEQQKQQQQGGGQTITISMPGNGGKGDKDGQGQGGQQMILDDHSLWKKGSQDKEFVTEKVKQVVNDAVERTGGIGHVPSDVAEAVNHLNYIPKDWKSDLQKFVSRASEILSDTSRKRRNRRYGILYPGIVTYPKLTLAACVDTSGSMPTEALEQIAAELSRIAKNNVVIHVIEADCVVQNVWEFDEKKLKGFRGRGGTAYQPALDKAAELDVDGIIYFGDMDSADKPKKPRVPLLWAIYGKQNPPATWGSKTEIVITKKRK